MPDLHDFRRHAENVLILNKNIKREDGERHTWRYKLAKGMLQVLDQMEHKKRLKQRATIVEEPPKVLEEPADRIDGFEEEIQAFIDEIESLKKEVEDGRFGEDR